MREVQALENDVANRSRSDVKRETAIMPHEENLEAEQLAKLPKVLFPWRCDCAVSESLWRLQQQLAHHFRRWARFGAVRSRPTQRWSILPATNSALPRV